MKFRAKERKAIDAVRWTGGNVREVFVWATELGLQIRSDDPEGAALTWKNLDSGPVELWAYTLHGEVQIAPGSWAAYGGTDVYPLADDELLRLYERVGEQAEPVLIYPPPPGYSQPGSTPGQLFATEDLTDEQREHVARVARYVRETEES